MSSRVVLFVAAALCLAGYLWVYATGVAHLPIRSDGFSYYVYLPSWFIFADTTLAAVARDCCGGEFPEYTAIIRWPETRRWVNAHPMGVAIMQSPAFAVAHFLTRWTNLSPDGFSLYYQHGAGLAGLGWIVAGLAMLRSLLLRSFSDRVTAATLLALLLGTNLYHYATFDSSYSHPYSFFLFASFMWLTDWWHAEPGTRRSVLLGIVTGLIVLVRHTNILFTIVFALYGVGTGTRLSARIAYLWRERGQIAWIMATAALVVSPQLLIYYQATGDVLVSSYGELGFRWTSPQIAGVLIGVKKGLFFWSPLLLLAVGGMVLLVRSARPASAFILPGTLFLIVHTYLIASWWDWQFGGSYGHRGFVDVLPLFALGLAATFSAASSSFGARAATAAGVGALVALSLFQMLQVLVRDRPVQRHNVAPISRAVPAVAMKQRALIIVTTVALVVASLAYLRDPPWLVRVTSGLGRWETDRDGTRYRWTTGHASFFVRSSEEFVAFRLRAPKEDPRDWPITATITIDDRPADVIKVSEDDWTTVRLRLPARAGRSARRIDVKVDRVRAQNRGVQLQVDGR